MSGRIALSIRWMRTDCSFDQGGADGLLFRSADADAAALDGEAFAGQAAHDVDEQLALLDLDALVQALLGVVVLHGDDALLDDRPGVDAGIDDVARRAGHLDAVGEGVANPVGSGEARQQGRMGVDDRGHAERRRAEDPHEAGRHDEARRGGSHLLGQRGVPRTAVGMLLRCHDKRRYAGLLGALEADARAVGADCRDPHPVGGVGGGVDEGLEQGARAGDEDDDVDRGGSSGGGAGWGIARHAAECIGRGDAGSVGAMGEDGRVTDPDLQDQIVFAREKAKRTLPVALLVLLGLTAMYLPLPKRFVAFVPLVLAVVLTVRLLRFLSPRTGREKIWPVVTLVIAGMLLSTLAVQVAFYDSVSAYEECLAGAQTRIAPPRTSTVRAAANGTSGAPTAESRSTPTAPLPRAVTPRTTATARRAVTAVAVNRARTLPKNSSSASTRRPSHTPRSTGASTTAYMTAG